MVGLFSRLGQRLLHRIGQRPHLGVRSAAANDEVVRQGGLACGAQHLDVFALFIVQRLDGDGGHFLFTQHIIFSFFRSSPVRSAVPGVRASLRGLAVLGLAGLI